MIHNELISIIEQLDRIEYKIDGRLSNKYLNIVQVVKYTSLRQSTIRRAVQRGELKVSHGTGKLLFKTEWLDRWIGG